ncbi:lipid-A-disaccharide synthase [Caulobacter sp. 17J65-9]|uniref:lipid-A-disaccharide synthase n=1 Tax=Caulobacter sp. 17J65-9 TaxID=2709382 RepID=UPI0013C9B1A5|nr:lipid-A-disaccharide synthase [Caulobacter sp. 17J65-9]NEX92699.1 lipid-A-disaccharide synthase [Caulobacter sp. 17J65-9]
MKPLTVMLVAAEASGDALGAGLARALKARLGDKVRFVGVGGSRMAAEGVESPFDIADLSILGWVEGVKAYGRVKRRVEDAAALARREKPDVAVLIDSWGYTLRVAKALRRDFPAMPLVKYVGPQVWASRPGRAKTLAGAVDHLLAIHVFDAPWFEREGLKTTFVGNNALHTDFSQADGERFRREIGAAPDDQILLVLPGSRPSEVMRMTPPFEEAIALLKRDRPNLKVAVVVADTVAEAVKGRVAGWPFRVHLVEGEAAKRDAMKASTVALACSGTVSIELALAGVPMVISYRLDKLTYALAKRIVKTTWVTLFNIAARDFVAPELIQDEATGPKLAAAVAERLDDPALRETQVARQYAALDQMGRGGPDPSEAAADAVLGVLAERKLLPGG